MSRGSTCPARAATIPPCRCGAVRTARHPRQKRRDAGSATDRAPLADPAVTSGDRSPPSSGIAGSTVSASRFEAMRSGPAGNRSTLPEWRPRRHRVPQQPGRWSLARIERPFGCSSSSRSAPRSPIRMIHRTRAFWSLPLNRAGVYGATRRLDPASAPLRRRLAGENLHGLEGCSPRPYAPESYRQGIAASTGPGMTSKASTSRPTHGAERLRSFVGGNEGLDVRLPRMATVTRKSTSVSQPIADRWPSRGRTERTERAPVFGRGATPKPRAPRAQPAAFRG